MISPEYAVQATAWLAVWTVSGLTARQWLAARELQRRKQR